MAWDTRPEDVDESRSCMTCRFLIADTGTDEWQCWQRGREMETHPRFPFHVTQCWGWERGPKPSKPPKWWRDERRKAQCQRPRRKKTTPPPTPNPYDISAAFDDDEKAERESISWSWPVLLSDLVDRIYERAMSKADGNKTKAAWMLGVNVKTVYNRVQGWKG